MKNDTQPDLQLFAGEGAGEAQKMGEAQIMGEPQSTDREASDASAALAPDGADEQQLEGFRRHIAELETQGEELKKLFPGFKLKEELKNPVFARMTAPGVGLSVEDAYYAVHRHELQQTAMQVTAQIAARKFANSIQAQGRRPDEAGTSSRAACVTAFDYRNATPQQRAGLRQRIYAAAAKGEKLYPGKY